MTNNTSSENHIKNDDLDLGLMTISNFSSISNNLSLENHVQNDFADIVLTFLGPTICNLSSVVCIGGLVTHLKNLHKLIKRHLMILFLHNFICSLISIGILIYMRVDLSFRSLEICSLLTQVVGPPAYITGENISLLSYMRYHLAWKTANNEAINKKKLIAMSVMVYTTEHLCGPLGYMASLYFEIPSGASSCAGLIMENELSLMPIFQIVKFVFAMAIGIVYDVLMIQFLRKPKNVIGPGQAKLVPWKSSYDTSNDNNIIVPASATIVTLVSVIVSIGINISIVSNLEDYNSNKGTWKIKTLLLIYNTGVGIGMPALVGLTIRAAKKKKPAPKIPHEPMFHDDSNFDQVEENDNKISDNKLRSYPQIQVSAKKKALKLSDRPVFHGDDLNLDHEEDENAIYVISVNDQQQHPFSPQIQESNL